MSSFRAIVRELSRKIVLLVVLFVCAGCPVASFAATSVCNASEQAGYAVLLGRLLVTGHVSADDAAAHEKSIKIGVRNFVNMRHNYSVTPLEDNPENIADLVLSKLATNVILKGTQGDKSALRLREALSQTLRERSCDFLFGGELSGGGKVTTVTPYLFDVATGTLSVPFAPISITSNTQMDSLTFEVAERLGRYLESRRAISPISVHDLEVGCFEFEIEADEPAARELAEAAIKLSVDELSADPKFSGRRVLGLPAECGDKYVKERKAPSRIRASARISSSSKKLLLSPRLSFRSHGQNYSFSIGEIMFGRQYREGTLKVFVGEIRSFVAALETPGFVEFIESLATEKNLKLSTDEAPKKLASLIETGAIGSIVGFGYQLVSYHPPGSREFAMGRLAIGWSLQRRNENALAITQLSIASSSANKFPDYLKGSLDEATGLAYSQLGANSAAISKLEAASRLYRRAARLEEERRVRKTIAEVRVKTGDLSRAKADLQSLPSIEADFSSLKILGEISRRLGDLSGDQGAIRWFTDAIKVRPSSSAVKEELSQLHGLLGERALSRKDLTSAEQEFRTSLKYAENPRVRYLAGQAAVMLGLYDRAISDFKAIALSSDATPFRWTEAATLNMLEVYLLAGDYDSVIREGKLASSVTFAKVADSRLVSMYLLVVAEALKNPSQPVDEFVAGESYRNFSKEIEDSIQSRSSVEWDNSKVHKEAAIKLSNFPEKLQRLQNLGRALFGS